MRGYYMQEDKDVFAAMAKALVPMSKFSDAFRQVQISACIDTTHFVEMGFADVMTIPTKKGLVRYINFTEAGFWAFVNYYVFMQEKGAALAIGSGTQHKKIR
jgi:hypothetical protein